MRVGFVEVLIGRDLAALHRQRGLDQAGDARGRLEVAEVGLGGADQQGGVGLPSPAVYGAKGARFDGVAEQRPGAVRLHVVDLSRLHTGVGARGSQHRGLGGRIGRHQPVGPAVLVDRRAADDGENAVSVAHRIGEPLEHGHPAALAADESVGRRVERVACAGLRHRLGLVEAARHDGGEHQVDAAGDGQLGLTGAQALAGQVHRHQGRGTGGVDGQRRALQVQEVGQPVGDDAQRAAGSGPRVDLAEVAGSQEPVLADARADEHPGLRALQGLRRNAGMFERLDGHLEDQPLLRIDVVGLARSDAEVVGVEARDVGQEGAPARGPRQGLRRLRGTVVERVPPAVGHGGHRGLARRHEVPQRVGSVDVTRQPAAEPDDGDRFGQGDGNAVGGAHVLGIGVGQRVRQTVDGRVLPDVDRRHVPTQQLGQLTGEHDPLTGADAEFVERHVEVDFVWVAADVGDQVVDQPVPQSSLVVPEGRHTAMSRRWNSPSR